MSYLPPEENGKFLFDYAWFIENFPAFSNATKFPETLLQNYWWAANSYINNYTEAFGAMYGWSRWRALNLMTAHIASLFVDIGDDNNNTGFVSSAAIDKVNVSVAIPPVNNGFDSWLIQSPYGQMLRALLKVKSVGGFLLGGSLTRSPFRNFNGNFNNYGC